MLKTFGVAVTTKNIENAVKIIAKMILEIVRNLILMSLSSKEEQQNDKNEYPKMSINPLQPVGLSLIEIIAVITKENENGTMIT